MILSLVCGRGVSQLIGVPSIYCIFTTLLFTMIMRFFREYKGLLVVFCIAIFLGYAGQPAIAGDSLKNSLPEKTTIKQHPFINIGSSSASAKQDRPINPSTIVKRSFPDLQLLKFASKLISSYTYGYSTCNAYCKPTSVRLSFIRKLQI